jgi:hypothetical protein
MAARALAAAVCVNAVLSSSSAPPCRDRRLQPFASTSIWNVAVGSGAVYEHAHIYDGSMNRSWACELRVTSPGRRTKCPGAPDGGVTPIQCEALGCCPDARDGQCFLPANIPPPTGFNADQELIVVSERARGGSAG